MCFHTPAHKVTLAQLATMKAKRDREITSAHAARHAARDIEEMGLGFAQRAAAKMRVGDDTPYADGYIAAVKAAYVKANTVRLTFVVDKRPA